MRALVLASVAIVALWMSGCADRVGDPHASTASYADLRESDVRGLTPEQIEGLRNGDGMGYALPAELNGYPGPKHVLEFATELGLTQAQEEATRSIRANMLAQARSTGEALIAAYGSLDEEFRSRQINESRLRGLTNEIGVLEGELRAIHMEAHLAMMAILTHEQIREYSELRGYGGHDQHQH